VPNALTAAAIAFGKPLYVQDPGNPSLPQCATAGVADPNPCYAFSPSGHTITEPAHGNYAVTFEVLYAGQPITVGRAS
jgi:hypothetical protein